jgi:hypothetical protein
MPRTSSDTNIYEKQYYKAFGVHDSSRRSKTHSTTTFLKMTSWPRRLIKTIAIRCSDQLFDIQFCTFLYGVLLAATPGILS